MAAEGGSRRGDSRGGSRRGDSGGGFWPTQVPQAGPAWAGENKWAARDRASYQADIKRLLTMCP